MVLPAFPVAAGPAIVDAIRAYGATVEFHPQAGGQDTIRASIQRPGQEGLIGDATQDWTSVFVVAADLSRPPERFDRVVFDGVSHAVDQALPHRFPDVVLVWELRVGGA